MENTLENTVKPGFGLGTGISLTKSQARAPYGLPIIESCVTCPINKSGQLCDLSFKVLAKFDSISSTASYPKGAVLFVEGQDPRGVFVICRGRVKLTASSAQGKSIILRIAEPGDVVGLPGTLSGRPYEVTAEALEPTQANFISRDDFRTFLAENSEEGVHVAEILTDIYLSTCREIRYLGLSASAAGKLAMFFLDQTYGEDRDNLSNRVTFTLSHQEIAEMIGTSRETVTRLFAKFKRKKLIEVHGSILVVANRIGLETLERG